MVGVQILISLSSTRGAENRICMTKRAQLAKRCKNMTEEGAAARCVRQIFPSLATWWVFILHNRNLHEWSGIHSTRMYPSDPTQKQVLVVRPRGGRSGKNWRIFVRPREVVVKMNFSPQAAGEMGIFTQDRTGRSLPAGGLVWKHKTSVCVHQTKPHSSSNPQAERSYTFRSQPPLSFAWMSLPARSFTWCIS